MVKWIRSDFNGAPTLNNTNNALITLMDALIAGFGSKTLTSLTVTSNVATAVVNAGHGFFMAGNTGPVVKIEGATPSGLNGEYRITVIDANTFTFATSGISDQTATGTITAKIAPLEMTKVFSGTSMGAYKFNSIQNTGAYLKITDNFGSYASVIMYETMSDINTGTNPTPTLYTQKSIDANTKKWLAVVDENILYLLISYQTNYLHGFIFGDPIPDLSTDAYHAVLTAYPNNSNSTSIFLLNTNYTYVMRPYAQVGTSVVTQIQGHYYAGSYFGGGSSSYPSAGNNKLFSAVECYESSKLRSIYPGLYAPMHGSANFVVDWSVETLVNKDLLIMRNGSYVVACDITGPWR